jgi:hypothetical protein
MAESREPDRVDLVATIRASIEAARQQRIDNTPCPTCGGDRLRPDFTDSGRCHAPIGRDHV